jgi:hypothetical protein
MNHRFIASELVKVANILIADSALTSKKAFEFPNKTELRKYLDNHPKADKRNHWIKNEKRSGPNDQDSKSTKLEQEQIKKPAKTIIVPKEKWPKGKEDPTQYSSDKHAIMVRKDYDIKADPAGWMVHERVHASGNIKDDNKPYPENAVERAAYTKQFEHLIKKGYKTLADILKIKTVEHKADHATVLTKYFQQAMKNIGKK